MSHCSVPRLILNYSDKVNIYKSIYFIPIPVNKTPLPPSMPLFQPLNECHIPYPTPMYNPTPYNPTPYNPNPSCKECKTCSCKR